MTSFGTMWLGNQGNARSRLFFPLPTLKLVEVMGTGFSGKGVMPQSLGQAEANHIQCMIWNCMLERNQNQFKSVCPHRAGLRLLGNGQM